MEQDFYKSKITDQNIEVIIPTAADMETVNKIIYGELCLATINERSKQEYLRIINQLHSQGAEGIVLGCTEIGLLIKPNDTSIPIYDTTKIHAEAAALLSLNC